MFVPIDYNLIFLSDIHCGGIEDSASGRRNTVLKNLFAKQLFGFLSGKPICNPEYLLNNEQ